ncbi:hypothetical protein IQ268_26560 [Oculatella sp. LEGE 06141]|uniref:hypothetical protein n=1 Tax=Oculatella sp. LEGE 06141 TaxID=1828648 RepID=UPI0018806699|nr:hypothetical protein [Oculatella sp. LEGE 06141]MBE9182133.1 hypothetical protein [Oculatella sp. LEGE 06141]
MLYLAQVQNADEGRGRLQLLAQQKSEYTWEVLDSEKDNTVLADTTHYREGMLVLVELSNTRQVQQVEDAVSWVLDVVTQYLSTGLSPDDLQEEVKRAEQWRQSLTLQSQELGRRALEMEARRDQIQELEEKLKREKTELETTAEPPNNIEHSPS